MSTSRGASWPSGVSRSPATSARSARISSTSRPTSRSVRSADSSTVFSWSMTQLVVVPMAKLISPMHQDQRHQAAFDGDRVVVAVADRGDRDDRPPQGVAEALHLGVVGAVLGVEHRQAAQEHHQQRAHPDEHRQARPRQLAAVQRVQHQQRRPEQSQRAHRREQHDQQFQRMRPQETPTLRGQAEPQEEIRREDPPDSDVHAGEPGVQHG